MPPEPTVSLEDLEAAKAELQRIEDRWENYSGNNPNKFVAQRDAARSRVASITRTLKAQGDLPLTEHEALCAEFDRIAPNARHNDEVEHDGASFRRIFSPARISLSGKTVTEWDRTWKKV